MQILPSEFSFILLPATFVTSPFSTDTFKEHTPKQSLGQTVL